MRDSIQSAKRIVIKVGTSTLVYPNGNINLGAINQLAFVLTDLRNQGKEVILVSSGAIGVGLNKLKLNSRPQTIPEQQAVAAVGQAALMDIYNQRFMTYGQQVGQVLLTRDVVVFPESRQNVTNTFNSLLKLSVIPIVNENDTVAIDELDHLTKFGDNDLLSAIVTEVTTADLLIMLSDIDGFYTANPVKDPSATLHSQISEISDEIMAQAGGSGTKFGTGGMRSKLNAAKRILANHKQMVLANGHDPLIICGILKGHDIGTWFNANN
ncbi:MAG: glutamate 5-kinase [Bavariicoccus seileri]|uniref:glutamate 5-kinase n=1 Tax=Bavariicoccus seileri TaxID=549685 RepID=UPI003F9BA578